MAALEARYRVSPEGLTGEAYVVALAERDGDGDEERAGRRLLVRAVCCRGILSARHSRAPARFALQKDYQEGRLGNFCLEMPPRDASESSWQADGPSRREVRIAAHALR
jgi:hypothetical protein